MVSVVIPVYNEEDILDGALSDLSSKLAGRELILADGQSDDRTKEIAQKYGHVIQSPRGRGIQMNAGGGIATGDILLFLHADCQLETGALEAIEKVMAEDSWVGGCLHQKIDAEGWGFRLIEFMIHSRLVRRNMYGDQGIFVRKATFFEMGGFPEIPIMEDLVFSKKLRKKGPTVRIKKQILTSPRRWHRLGKIKTTLINWELRILFSFGVPSETLVKLYYDNRGGE